MRVRRRQQSGELRVHSPGLGALAAVPLLASLPAPARQVLLNFVTLEVTRRENGAANHRSNRNPHPAAAAAQRASTESRWRLTQVNAGSALLEGSVAVCLGTKPRLNSEDLCPVRENSCLKMLTNQEIIIATRVNGFEWF